MQCLTRTQFQFLGIGVEVSLEVRNRQTVGMFIIHAESAAHIDMLCTDTVTVEDVL